MSIYIDLPIRYRCDHICGCSTVHIDDLMFIPFCPTRFHCWELPVNEHDWSSIQRHESQRHSGVHFLSSTSDRLYSQTHHQRGFAVIAALNDMMGNTRDIDTGSTGRDIAFSDDRPGKGRLRKVKNQDADSNPKCIASSCRIKG
jgi:hypothetical protein